MPHPLPLPAVHPSLNRFPLGPAAPGPRCPRLAPALTLAFGLVCSGAVLAQSPTSLTECRAVREDAARLRCYDRLADAQAPVAVAPTPARPAVAAGPVVSDPVQAFGLPPRPAAPVVAAPAAPAALDSTIPGPFDGWTGNTRFTLANGQVWQIIDGSEAAYSLRDPKVRISRGSFGNYFLQVEGVSQTPKVRRVQ